MYRLFCIVVFLAVICRVSSQSSAAALAAAATPDFFGVAASAEAPGADPGFIEGGEPKTKIQKSRPSRLAHVSSISTAFLDLRKKTGKATSSTDAKGKNKATASTFGDVIFKKHFAKASTGGYAKAKNQGTNLFSW